MAFVRILVDGYSLLYGCPDFAPGIPRHSAAAREELIRWLINYGDAVAIPITVVFDGAGAPPGTPPSSPPAGIEVLYSRAGQTADDLIERAAHRLQPYGEVLVVTDDLAERDTVVALGASASSCANFRETVKLALDDLQHDVKEYNQRESQRFKTQR